MTLEIPPKLWAARAAVGLIVACVIVIEMVVGRYPGGRMGAGLVAGTLLLAWSWLWLERRPRLVAASLDRKGGWLLRFSDSRTVPATMLPGSRALGSTVVLRWKADRRVRSVWLTSRDVPADRLRELTVRLLSTGARNRA